MTAGSASTPITTAPQRVRARAIAEAIPPAAPVTMAALPVRSAAVLSVDIAMVNSCGQRISRSSLPWCMKVLSKLWIQIV
jgi:hypothetical protein